MDRIWIDVQSVKSDPRTPIVRTTILTIIELILCLLEFIYFLIFLYITMPGKNDSKSLSIIKYQI